MVLIKFMIWRSKKDNSETAILKTEKNNQGVLLGAFIKCEHFWSSPINEFLFQVSRW